MGFGKVRNFIKLSKVIVYLLSSIGTEVSPQPPYGVLFLGKKPQWYLLIPYN
jgi:hypothetical protein